MSGQLIDRGKVSDERIDVSSFQTGFYMIEFFNFSENKRCLFSVIKSR